LQEIELNLLLEGIQRQYGFDFRHYSRAPLRRGLQRAMATERVTTISGLQERVLHDAGAMGRLVGAIGVHVTAFFREPSMFAALRAEVFPLLRTYPSVRVWVAGCATGEEAYSLAVLMEEAGLLGRATIFATDMNADALHTAKEGRYPRAVVEEAEGRHALAGGTGSLAQHCSASRGVVSFGPQVRSRLTWAVHNLVTDASFNEFHLVLCANVMIYFDRELQRRVYGLLDQSVVSRGFLALSRRETIPADAGAARFRRLTPAAAIFRKEPAAL